GTYYHEFGAFLTARGGQAEMVLTGSSTRTDPNGLNRFQFWAPLETNIYNFAPSFTVTMTRSYSDSEQMYVMITANGPNGVIAGNNNTFTYIPNPADVVQTQTYSVTNCPTD